MKLIWSELNYCREVPFGKNLYGISYKLTRCDKIIIYMDEVPNITVEYLIHCMRAMHDGKIEIGYRNI